MIEKTLSAKNVFVNREDELDRLKQILETVISTGSGKVVLVSGDYGVGKSSFVQKFLQETGSRYPDYLVGIGDCAFGKIDYGLEPFSQILKGLAKQNRFVTPEQGRRFWGLIKKVAPLWLDIVTMGLATPIFATIDESTKAISGAESYATQANINNQYFKVIANLAKNDPLILVLDDLHWADLSSLNLFSQLCKAVENHKVLIIATYRPYEALKKGRHASYMRELLPELARQGVEEISLEKGVNVWDYARARYPNNDFPDDFLNEIGDRTQGHALFVAELFSMYENFGRIHFLTQEKKEGKWVLVRQKHNLTPKDAKRGAKDSDLPSIPKSITKILDARIEELDEIYQEILSRAAVEGEEFYIQTLARLLSLDELKVLHYLNILENKYLLVDDVPEDEKDLVGLDIFRFTSRFFRDHIYQKMNPTERQILHAKVGECLESLVPDPKLLAGRLQQHFYEGQVFDKAVHYCLLAVENERARFAWAEAHGWCQRGIEILNKHPALPNAQNLTLKLLEIDGQVLYSAGEYAKAKEVHAMAIHFALELKDSPQHIATLCAVQADICEELDDYEDMASYLQTGKEALVGEELAASEEALELDSLTGLYYSRFGKTSEAVELLRQVIARSYQMPPSTQLLTTRGWAFDHLAIALGYTNHFADAAKAYQEGVNAGEQLGNILMTVICRVGLARELIKMGEYLEAEKIVSDALKEGQKIGSVDLEGFALGVRGRARLRLGRLISAERDLEQAVQLGKIAQTPMTTSQAYAELSEVKQKLGNHEAAKENARLAMESAGKDFRNIAIAHLANGRVFAAENQFDQAYQEFEQAIQYYQRLHDRHGTASSKKEYALALITSKDEKNGSEMLAEAIGEFRALGLEKEVKQLEGHARKMGQPA